MENKNTKNYKSKAGIRRKRNCELKEGPKKGHRLKKKKTTVRRQCRKQEPPMSSTDAIKRYRQTATYHDVGFRLVFVCHTPHQEAVPNRLRRTDQRNKRMSDQTKRKTKKTEPKKLQQYTSAKKTNCKGHNTHVHTNTKRHHMAHSIQTHKRGHRQKTKRQQHTRRTDRKTRRRQTDRRTDTNTDRHKHRDRQTQRQTYTDTERYKQTQAQTDTGTDRSYFTVISYSHAEHETTAQTKLLSAMPSVREWFDTY